MVGFSFSKYQGSGNDFILIDDRLEMFPAQDHTFVAHLCDRHFGVGADGLILLSHSRKADIRMRIFNSDGKEAQMCGNGLRCLVRFAQQLGVVSAACVVETAHALYECSLENELIRINMGSPRQLSWNATVPLGGGSVIAHVVHTGVPHAVVLVDDVSRVDVEQEGREIRFHPLFQPEGVNATFVSLDDRGRVHFRTYERGVEGETLSCGTGAVAAAFVAIKCLGVKNRLEVFPRSQERMEIRMLEGTMEMAGEARSVFKGFWTEKTPQVVGSHSV